MEYPVPLRSMGVKDHLGEVARIDYLKKKYKMTGLDIAKAAKEVVPLK